MIRPLTGSLLKDSAPAIFAEARVIIDHPDIALDTLMSYSKRKVTWQCSICKHKWDTAPKERSRGSGCPKCAKHEQTHARLGSSLADLHPDIASEFIENLHFSDMRPKDLRPYSSQQCLWKCNYCGNEWKALVYLRTRGQKCPNCNGIKYGLRTIAPIEKSLQTLYPHIASQFIANETNSNKTPDILWPGSNDSCRWRCSYGHEWVAKVESRALIGNGCAKCSGQKQSRLEFEVVEILRAATSEEVELNATVQAVNRSYKIDIVFSRIGLFIDLDPSHWHSRERVVQADQRKSDALISINYVRVRDQSLPNLPGRTVVVPDNCMDAYRWFQALRPIFLENNISWIELNSSSIATALAIAALNWNETSYGRPKLSALEHSPHLIDEFIENLTRPGIGLEMLTPSSTDQCRWRCPYCSNKWIAYLCDRTRYTIVVEEQVQSNGCPSCTRRHNGKKRSIVSFENSLAALYPEIAMELIQIIGQPDRTAADISPGSNYRGIWKCQIASHDNWEAEINQRTSSNSGCPICGIIKRSRSRAIPKVGKSLQDIHPQIAAEFVSNLNHPERTPTEIYVTSLDLCLWRCTACDHEWETKVKYRTKINGTSCPTCHNQLRTSEN